jgi:hypothetical protein
MRETTPDEHIRMRSTIIAKALTLPDNGSLAPEREKTPVVPYE